MTPFIFQCSNTYCNGYTDQLGGLCPDCKRREQMTEMQEVREKGERIEQWEKHKRRREKKGGKHESGTVS